MPADAMSYPDPHDDDDIADDDEEDDEDVDAADEDGVVYPVEETVGETGLQQFVILGLMLPLRDYFAAQARDVLVSTDQFIYYRRGDPTGVVCPDIYLIDGETIAPQDVECWKLWEHDDKPPQLAIEVFSNRTYGKDYNPKTLTRYQDLGVRELIRYDPYLRKRRGRRRRQLTYWVRHPDGTLKERDTSDNRMYSDHFGFWLIRQPDRSLRMSPDGVTLWPTASERAASETTARLVAEAEIQRLRAELARRDAH